MFNTKRYKKLQIDAWDGVADTFDRGFSGLALPATRKLIESARIQPGAHVLELGTANGADAFLLAEAVGPAGKVVGIDLAPRMIAVANANREARGVANLEVVVMDAEDLSFKPNTFDAVVCKWSLEQFTDSHKALTEALRVLKPGGVLSTLVVGRPERSKFLSLGPLEIFRIDPKLITAEPGAPSTFEFAPEGALEGAYNAAGFTNVQSQTLTLMITCADGETYWDLIANGNGFMKHKLDLAGPAVAAKARLATIATASSYAGADGIRLPFEVVLGWGEKPAKGARIAAAPMRVKSLDEVVEENKPPSVITATQLGDLLERPGTLVIDIRTLAEHAAARIPGAIHAPRSVLESRIGKLVIPGETRHIVLCSGTGRTARLAAATLVGMGYEGVSALWGGFVTWRGPVEAG